MRLAVTARIAPLLCICACASAQDWTEKDFLEKVEVGAAARELRARVSVARAEAAGRGLYPNPSVSYSREGAGFTEFYQAEQLLPTSGRRSLLKQAGARSVTALDGEVSALLWSLRNDARRAFYRAVATQVQTENLRNGIAGMREIIRILAERERLGEGSRFDRLRAERELAEVEAELSGTLAETQSAIADMRALLSNGVEVMSVRGSLMSPIQLPAISDLLHRATNLRPEIKAWQCRIESYRLEQSAAERLKYPEPIVAVGVKRASAFGRTDTGSAVGVSIPVPIFNTGKTEVQLFAAERGRAVARLEATSQRIRAQVEGARAVAEVRMSAFELYRQQTLKLGADLVRIARTAYQEGEAGILELLDSLRAERQAQARSVELQMLWTEAKVELDRAVGEEVIP